MAGTVARIFVNISSSLQLHLHSFPFVSNPRTTMAAPVHVVSPLAAPEPTPDAMCAEHSHGNARNAAGSGNWSTVTDCNIELRRHHREHP